MNKTNYFIALLMVVMSISSCSEDNVDEQVVFTSLVASETKAFIENEITLTVTGTGYDEIIVVSENDDVVVEEIIPKTYKVTATKTTSGKIYVQLKNGTYDETKIISVNFYEHGLKDFQVLEGIKIGSDTSAQLLDLFGEPEHKSDNGSTAENWTYMSKGINFVLYKTTNKVVFATAFSSNYYVNVSDTEQVSYTTYPYELPNGWKVNQTTMNSVVDKYGNPNNKYSSDTTPIKTYQYTSNKFYVSFYGDTEDDYFGKEIKLISIY
jgi:hypothetical protein